MHTPLFSRFGWVSLWLSLLLGSPRLHAQTPFSDSLRRVLASQRTDTARVRLLQRLVDLNDLTEDPDDLRQLVALLRRLRQPQYPAYRRWLATARVHFPFQHYPPPVLQGALDSLLVSASELNQLGRPETKVDEAIANLYSALHRPAAAQAYLRQQLRFYYRQPARWWPRITEYLWTLGRLCEEQGDYNQAIGCYLQALEWATRYDPHPLVPSEGYYYDLIGSAYAKWGNQAKAQASFQRALHTYPPAETLSDLPLYYLTRLEISLATAEQQQQQVAAALRVIESAQRHQARLDQHATAEFRYGNALNTARLLVLKSSLLLDQQQPVAAQQLLLQERHVARANHLDTVNFVRAAPVWARYYAQRGQLPAATAAWRRAYQQARLLRSPTSVLLCARQLAQVYQAQHQPARAAPYALAALQVADSLAARQGSALVARYEIVQADRAQAAQLTQTRRQQRQALAQAQTQRRALRYTAAGVVGLLLLAGVLYAAFRRSRRLARLVTAQKQDLQLQRDQLDTRLTELRTTQAQLLQKEKMASLGELTAGIAHEIQNPLNFVNNFAGVSQELVEELQAALATNDTPEARALAGDLAQNLQKIGQHGGRASGIVKGMLAHSRQSTGERQLTDVNALSEEYLRLAYHGLRAKDPSFNTELQTDLAPGLPLVEAVPGDLGRVLLNLLTNAFYAVQQRQRTAGADYVPTVSIRTRQAGAQVEIQVSDNGTGMSPQVQTKIFQPFFTTKPAGEGTGLGLSLSYDLITQGHGGTLAVESQVGQGSTFRIRLPLA